MTREICKACCRESAVGFSVPDHVWAAAVEPEMREKVLCVTCFTTRADRHLVPWDREIQFWPVSRVTMGTDLDTVLRAVRDALDAIAATSDQDEQRHHLGRAYARLAAARSQLAVVLNV